MVCQSLGTSLAAVSGNEIEDLYQAVIDAVDEYLLDGKSHNRSIVDTAFEVFDRMDLIAGEDYQLIINNTQVAFRINQLYDRFTKYIADHHVEIEVLPQEAFLKQLRQAPYFIGTKTVVFSNGRYKAQVLDAAKLAATVELENIIVGDVLSKAG